VGGSFERLAWDSELFGFDVARLVRPFDESDLARALRDLRAAGVVLAYAFVAADDEPAARAAEAHGGRLVDTKVTYSRTLAIEPDVRAPSARADVVEYEASDASPELERLALQSGAFSRFRTDPDVPREAFERLYRTWIRRSVAREIADRVLVVSERDASLGGLVTLRFDGATGRIGLLAVESDSRGHGYGRQLLDAAHDLYRERGCSSARVVTQAANAPACRLFETFGYEVAERERVFHFWLASRSRGA
jgi:dTDP-4-amino-4,6-dideoxy-D-galactose acyltransferase